MKGDMELVILPSILGRCYICGVATFTDGKVYIRTSKYLVGNM